jgi:hypothetical protein
MQLPLRHQDTNPDNYRDHKELIFNELLLVQLSAVVPWWQKRLFSGDLIFQRSIEIIKEQNNG